MFGVEIKQTNALEIIFMGVQELVVLEVIILIQLNQQDLELKKHSLSNMEELNLKLNYQKENGYGLHFGYYQKINFMVTGQLLEKLM